LRFKQNYCSNKTLKRNKWAVTFFAKTGKKTANPFVPLAKR